MDNRHLMDYEQDFCDYEREHAEGHVFSEEDITAIWKFAACKYPPFGSYTNCVRLALHCGFIEGYRAAQTGNE